MLTNHRMFHFISTVSSLGKIQRTSDNEDICAALSQLVDKSLKSCPVVPVLPNQRVLSQKICICYLVLYTVVKY